MYPDLCIDFDWHERHTGHVPSKDVGNVQQTVQNVHQSASSQIQNGICALPQMGEDFLR
jgi:hypothetical protein